MAVATGNIAQQSSELQKRILFTLLILVIYRVGVHIPTPGVNPEAAADFMKMQGGMVGFANTFTGGALEQMAILALGIMPYISSSIIFQLLTSAVPYLENLKKEGEHGRKKISQYTRYGAVLLGIIQAFGIVNWLSSATAPNGIPVMASSYLGIIPFKLFAVTVLVAGAMFVIWLGEQITERGIGEGASVIIFAGIAASIPKGAVNLYTLVSEGQLNGLVALMILIMMVLVIGAIIFLENGQRRIPIHISQKGGRAQIQQASYLPLKINMTGVIPPIFASSLLLFPATIANFVNAPWLKNIQEYLTPSGGLYIILFVFLIFFFSFFYTEIVFPPHEMADNLKKSGKFIPGIRAGKSTADFIKKVIDRVSVAGAIYLSAICILPTVLIAKLNVPFYFGGTSLLILVGVAIQLIEKINAYRYETLLKASSSVRTRRRRVQF